MQVFPNDLSLLKNPKKKNENYLKQIKWAIISLLRVSINSGRGRNLSR